LPRCAAALPLMAASIALVCGIAFP